MKSSSSITLSGDGDALDVAEKALQAKGTFARSFELDTAYHRALMTSCAEPSLGSLLSCGIWLTQLRQAMTMTSVVRVLEGTPMTVEQVIGHYQDNMRTTVFFVGTIAKALE